ncbi:MAG: hypothetical protein ACP5OZ_02605 [Candidatus Woesearchaeota archaeon]
MNAIDNKKGIFFTIIAISLLAIILLSISYTYSYKNRKQMEAIGSRIRSMDNFVSDLDKDLERGIYISGFRTILGMQSVIEEKGSFLESSKQSFKEIFMNGSINQTPVSIMNDSYFSNWIEKIEDRASELNIGANIVVNDVIVNQTEPWFVDVSVNMSIELNDSNRLASWNKTIFKTVKISIIGFEDPLYFINSYGKISNIINKTPYENFVISNNTTNLLLHLNRSYYVASNKAPNFLMRFENNLSSSEQGIESLVNLQEFANLGLQIKERSVVDYIYFGNRTTFNLCVNNTLAEPDLPSWFRLDTDDNHVEKYQIVEINSSC